MLPNVPKIAVLLAAYNGMQWIEEQLLTIQSQSEVLVHIIISVDASCDGTEAWCHEYAAQHGNVTLLPPREPCGGAARNFFHLLRNADFQSFDFIALADQDDLWHANKLQRAVCHLASHPVHAYSSNVTAFWPDGRTQLIDKAQAQVEWDHYFEAAGPGCTYVMKKQFGIVLQSTIQLQWGLLQSVTLHDWFIYAFARTHGYGWYIDPITGMDYRQHPTNQVGANVGMGALRSRIRTIRSGWWFGQIQLIEAIVSDGALTHRRPAWRSLKRGKLIYLALNAKRCRRRIRDQWLFGVLCLAAAIVGVNIR